MATHSSILAWEIPWLKSLVSYSPWDGKRVRHDLATKQQYQDSYCIMQVYNAHYREDRSGSNGHRENFMFKFFPALRIILFHHPSTPFPYNDTTAFVTQLNLGPLGQLYSGLENSMGCIVHGVAKSQTWLSNLHFSLSPKPIYWH